MRWLREIDGWLVDQVLPFAADYRRLAARLVGPADADDLVQEAYARLLAAENWREIGNVRAFTLRVVRNLALERLRRSSVVKFEQIAVMDDLQIADDTPDAHAVLAGRNDLARLLALIETLSPQRRRVVWLRKIEGLPPAAIAAKLHISVSTVEKHLVKGLTLLTDALRDDSSPESRRPSQTDARRTAQDALHHRTGGRLARGPGRRNSR